jgi:transcriptional regulator with XRE-family HTH domain
MNVSHTRDGDDGGRVLRLRQIREERGFTLRETARFLGVSPSTLSLIERGQHPCFPKWRQGLERLFQVDSGSLLSPADPRA